MKMTLIRKVPPRSLALPIATFLPALLAWALIGSTASGAGLFALLSFLRTHLRKSGEITRQLSRRLSRRLSHSLSDIKLNTQRSILRSSSMVKGAFAFVLCLLARRAVMSLRRSLALMNPYEQELDESLKEKLAANNMPHWGEGLPLPPVPGIWRPFLLGHKTAQENLRELHGMLGIVNRPFQSLTIDQLTEGVRRVLMMKYTSTVLATTRYWSETQARSIATALAADCNMPLPLASGGLEECGGWGVHEHIPWQCPMWLQVSQRLSLAALGPFFQSAWSWGSRYIETPVGLMHIYDTCPSARIRMHHEPPPLLLQHGAFVTGWSMALLAWLLSLRGRRVIIPDLFDYDNGLSASSGLRNGGSKVRKGTDHAETLIHVVRAITQEDNCVIDIAGHSFGGFLAVELAERCLQEGLRVRKVVLLGPGGPPCLQAPNPVTSRFFNDPHGTLEELRPWWLPRTVSEVALKLFLGTLLSPNNCNLLFGNDYHSYLGKPKWGTTLPTLLLWGDADNIAWPREPQYLGPYLRASFGTIDAFWISGGGHNIQFDSAVAVARKMHAWLDPVPAGDRPHPFIETLLQFTNRRVYAMDLPHAVDVNLCEEASVRSRI